MILAAKKGTPEIQSRLLWRDQTKPLFLNPFLNPLDAYGGTWASQGTRARDPGPGEEQLS